MRDGRRFGSYELIDRIGRGGMAEVWRARSRGAAGFEKEVVLKRVLPSLMAGSDFAELLIREAKIAARLHHPNVVQIFDLGEQDGAYFIAMEYVAGCDLATAVRRHPSPWIEQGEQGLSLPLRLFIVTEAARALDYAHRRQDDEGRPLHIVHRDISPQNILLGFEGEVKVADFGIARADAIGLGAEEDPGILRGKYAYMSPEQARSESLDGRSDLFALGIVLWELVTGRRLFKTASTEETLERVRRAEIPEVSTEAWPPGLPELITLALAPAREQRFATAGEFGDALTDVLHRSYDAVDNADLARVLVELLPNAAERRVNKLRVDLDQRIGGDVAQTMTALTAAAPSEETRAFPASRRLSVLVRPVPSLVVRPESGSAMALEEIALAHAALVGAAPGAEVVWTFADGDMAGLATALRVVHEWRCAGGVGPALVVEGDARVWEGGRAAEVEPAVLAEARERLEQTPREQTRCAPNVARRMESRYRFGDGEWPALLGYRLRAERDFAAHLRLPLMGRREEITRLLETFQESASEGRSLWIVGEAGSGKSRLLAELHARAESALLLTGRPAGSSPFGLLADLFADLTGVNEADEPATRAEKVKRLRVLGLGEHLLARVGELLLTGDAPAERAGRPRGLDLCAALGRAVAALAHDGPVVVVLEDLQEADEASLQLLPLLRASLLRPRVLTVFTSRPPAPSAPLAEPELRLEPLAAGAGGRLFARAAGGRSVEAELEQLLASELDGTPGALVDVARLLVSEGRLGEERGVFRLLGGDPLPIPARWRSDRMRGLADLSSKDRGVLAALAVLREPCDTSTLAAVCAQPALRVELCLRRLLDLGLVAGAQGERHRLEGRWGGEGGDVRLPAELHLRGGVMARRALLSALGEERVQDLHGRVSRLLGSAGAAADERVERLAYHAARARDRREAPRWLALSAARARGRGELSLAA
ncbi:MAG: protein kinase, partial [Deltaproteobacteria bacterium]|nr:protein kinase [Deltaproteobacteria bacterium]